MNVLITTHQGKAIIFKESEVRPTGRASIGVRGIELKDGDEIASSDVFVNADFKKNIFVIGKKGVGKKTNLSLFKGQHRGGKGVKVASVDEKNRTDYIRTDYKPHRFNRHYYQWPRSGSENPLSLDSSTIPFGQGSHPYALFPKGDEVVSATLV